MFIHFASLLIVKHLFLVIGIYLHSSIRYIFIVYCLHLVPFQCSPESITTVREWLKKLPSEGIDAVDCGSLTLDKPQIAAIEKAVCDMQVCVCGWVGVCVWGGGGCYPI